MCNWELHALTTGFLMVHQSCLKGSVQLKLLLERKKNHRLFLPKKKINPRVVFELWIHSYQDREVSPV